MKEMSIGPYVVIEKLGAGGMGEVYRARDDRLEREVAIKRLPEAAAEDDELRRALLQEARSVARIAHQNVAALHDVVEEGGQLYLVMELVPGEPLSSRLRRPLPLDSILEIAIQCAEGLAAAHRQGVVHRDVKPDNIVISSEGTAKILDFGVARASVRARDVTHADTDPTHHDSAVRGTLPFMAPEALLGNRVDGRADIFSLGVTLYRMLAGVHPFAAATQAATVDRILHGEPTPVVQLNPRVPDYLLPILDKMLSKSPHERYATMDDLLVDLRASLMRLTRPHTAPIERPIPATTLPGRNRSLAVAGMAAVPLALLIGGVAYFLGPPDGNTPWSGSGASSADRFRASDWVIAVLPAGDVEESIAPLSEGLAATLTGKLTQLSRAHDLQVVPASALRQRAIADYAAARRELGVTLAVDFQLRQVGERLRATVNLIDTRTDRQLSSVTVDGSADDPIDLEEQVALRAVRLLRLELLPMESGLLAPGTREPRAHGYYLRAAGYLQEYDRPESVDAAVQLLEQALRVDPGYARARALLGEALWSRYRLTDEPRWVERAAAECREAIAADPMASHGHRCLGTVLEGTGRTAEAIESLERARELDPTDDASTIALGTAYVALGELDRAEATYEEAIALRPHYWGGYSWLGVFYLSQGRYAEAVAQLERVVQLAPDSYRGFSNLGAAYYYAEDWSRARQAFERALELNPEFHSAVSNIGTLLFYEGRYTESATMFERAVQLAGANYLLRGNLADAYHWSEQIERAAQEYARAIELADTQLAVNPDAAEINAHVARYHAMLRAAEPALRHLERALAIAPTDVDVLHAAAQIHAALGDTDRALEYLEQAVRLGYQKAEIAVDPLFSPLRADPRYGAIMAA